MANLTVWKFDTAEGATRAEEKLKALSSAELITIDDAAVVQWVPGAKKPKTHQMNSLTGVGAMGGAFWGLLFGLIFFVPLLGAAIGAATGALGGSLTDVGIDDDFIEQMRSKVTPGTSALFVLTEAGTMDKVHDAFAADGIHAELLYTNLDEAQEAKLREVFGA